MTIMTTGIGSLPIEGPDDAWHYARKAYDLPFLPQPAQEIDVGGMVSEVLPRGMRCSSRSHFPFLLEDSLESLESCGPWKQEPTEEFVPLLERVLGVFERWSNELPQGLKMQMMGPVSLSQTVKDCHGRPLWTSDILRGNLTHWCRSLAAALAARLAHRADPLVLWLDEPLLGLMTPGEDRDAALHLVAALCRAMVRLGFRPGVHCCSAPPFDLLPLLPEGCDFSFDLVRFPPSDEEISDLCRPFLAREGRLALGVITPLDREHPEEELCTVPGILEQLCPLPQERSLQFLLTPSCGTVLTPLSREQKISHLLRLWSHQWSQ